VTGQRPYEYRVLEKNKKEKEEKDAIGAYRLGVFYFVVCMKRFRIHMDVLMTIDV
jgi:hypothetical protein